MEIHEVNNCGEVNKETVMENFAVMTLMQSLDSTPYCTFNRRFTTSSFDPYILQGKAFVIKDTESNVHLGCGILEPVVGLVELSQYWQYLPELRECSPPIPGGYAPGWLVGWLIGWLVGWLVSWLGASLIQVMALPPIHTDAISCMHHEIRLFLILFMPADGLLGIRAVGSRISVRGTLVGLQPQRKDELDSTEPKKNTSIRVYNGTTCQDIGIAFPHKIPFAVADLQGMVPNFDVRSSIAGAEQEWTSYLGLNALAATLGGRAVVVRDEDRGVNVACGVIRSLIPGYTLPLRSR